MIKKIPLRTLVATIGLAVAIITAVTVPVGYALSRFVGESDHLAEHTRLGAGRLARYIYTHDSMWQYQQSRLAEILELNDPSDFDLRQRVVDAQGELVVEEGPSLGAPVLAQSVPIVVAGATVGHLEVASSLRPLFPAIGLVTAFSAVLGFAVYFTVRVWPLRVLDRTLGELHETERHLAEQNSRFDAALTNMSQGLVMFDANGRIVIFNPHFAEIYGIPPEKIAPGMRTPELMRFALGCGVADVDAESTLTQIRTFIRERKGGPVLQHLADGRSILISHQPMPDGGFVATFEDITERLRSEEKINHLARFDALTDLPNRATFYERLQGVVTHLRRSESISILSVDLDHFKNVNDTLGHPIGDLLLKNAADRMRSCVRGEDIVARLGGDEFAFVQVSTDTPSSITALASRLIGVVGAPYDLEGHQVVVG